MNKADKENRFLAALSFITCTGDHLSFFSLLSLIDSTTGKIELAAYLWSFKSLGIALGGMLLPSMLARSSLKKLLFASQILAGLCMLFVFVLWSSPSKGSNLTVFLTFGAFLFSNVLQKIFDNSKETYSKGLPVSGSDRHAQAVLYGGLSSAAVVGPLLALLIIMTLSPTIGILIDTVTFFGTAFLILSQLKQNVRAAAAPSLFRPFTYLGYKPELRRILILRGILFWIPTGIWNYIVFAVVQKQFGLTSIQSAWTFAALGFGAVVGSSFLRDPALDPKGIAEKIRLQLSKVSNNHLAGIAVFLLGASKIGFTSMPSLPIALTFTVMAGVFVGLNAVSTQAIRRKLTTDDEFPEIVSLEGMLGKLTEFTVASLSAYALLHWGMTYQMGIWATVIGFWLVAAVQYGRNTEAPQSQAG